MVKIMPRERVRISLNHKKPDRVPIDLGGQSNSTLTYAVLQNLRKHIGNVQVEESFISDKRFQTVDVPEDILVIFNVDFRSIKIGKPVVNKIINLPDGGFINEWGVEYMPSAQGLYHDISRFPLCEYEYENLESYNWPDPNDPGWAEGLKEKAEYLYSKTNYSLIGNFTSSSIFELCWSLRGFEKFLMDLVINQKFANKLLRIVTNIQKERIKNYLAEIGHFIDIIKISDDLSGQISPFISPDTTYRKMIMPYQKDFLDYIKKFTNAKIALHCCGNARPFLKYFIEIGVEIFHPFQFSCPAMDPQGLKNEFGKDLVFWGGIDVQEFLPYANPSAVRNQVKKIIEIMGKDGGYIFSPSHNLQADIPAENIIAMYEAAIILK